MPSRSLPRDEPPGPTRTSSAARWDRGGFQAQKVGLQANSSGRAIRVRRTRLQLAPDKNGPSRMVGDRALTARVDPRYGRNPDTHNLRSPPSICDLTCKTAPDMTSLVRCQTGTSLYNHLRIRCAHSCFRSKHSRHRCRTMNTDRTPGIPRPLLRNDRVFWHRMPLDQIVIFRRCYARTLPRYMVDQRRNRCPLN